MTWQPELDEMARRAALAREMGGAERVAVHHERGKLTVRERIDLLADPGAFEETGVLAGKPEWDGSQLAGLTPANSVVGVARVHGRKVAVQGDDFTIRGGSADGFVGQKGSWAIQHAYMNRIPFVRLLDATGGSVRHFEELGRTYLSGPEIGGGSGVDDLIWRVPVVSVVLGSVAGAPAVIAADCHFNVMVKGTSQLFVGGPPVVQASRGLAITKEELGGEQVHVFETGVVANLAEDEADAMRQVRRFLSYLPQNAWEAPPRLPPEDDPARRDEALLSAIPRDTRRPYDARALLARVVDRDSFFEIQPHWGRPRITGLARVDGYPVGIMANNPSFNGGSTDRDAAEKVTRLIQLCDTFHLPLVYLCDEPGFSVGPAEERRGIIRAGARLMLISRLSETPYVVFILRQAYGVAGGLQYRRGRAMYRRYAWPSAHWGSMHIEGGVTAAYRREIAEAPDPEAKRAEIEARLNELRSPLRTAHAFGIEDMIDPRETRPLLVDFVRDAQAHIATALGPTSRIPYLP
ncbi:MAG: hypothetical protein O2895_03035 [Chloroflexi bacterium]|nr:hypothetical protein [Chloroflexota bacterium]